MKKKLDGRIKTVIENCVASKHRSIFVIVGHKGIDQIPILHHVMMKVKSQSDCGVLWAYKKEIAFDKKKMRTKTKKRRKNQGLMDEDDPFQSFIKQTNIRWCYYNETNRILGQTYGMCVLQDFEAVTPNTLARTMETVVGGGLIIILLRTMNSLKQLYTMTMDVHSRYRTETHEDVVGRFNERFILSLAKCPSCLIIDDQLNVLPISSNSLTVLPVAPKSELNRLSEEELQLKKLKHELMDDKDTQLAGSLVGCCLTHDQAKGVLMFIEAIVDKSVSSTVVMKAARGRGKSAALGLAMAAAVAFGYSNVFVTAPSPENLTTMFEFICKGLNILRYEEHLDYEKVVSAIPGHNKSVVAVNVFKTNRQTIKYIEPTRSAELVQAELVCIDEAAAIPLPFLRELLGPYLVFMSSTVDGYEGTGQTLSQKLIKDLRQNSNIGGELDLTKVTNLLKARTRGGPPLLSGRTLYEVTLTDSIRYANEDPVERWLSQLLCLNISRLPTVSFGCPAPSNCELFYVNRDTLFSFHDKTEEFLQRFISICVASDYKHSPDDLQMMSDAPGHHLFCLLGPKARREELPEILCVLHVSLEGEISKESIANSIRKGIRSGGDVIPWTIEEQFGERDFACKSGVRIVRIATHPSFQSMGYGTRSMQLLQQYYEGKMPCSVNTQLPKMDLPVLDADTMIGENLKPRENLPPLLISLNQRRPESLDYIGVSYGMSIDLLRFWKRFNMTPVYTQPNPSAMTGDHQWILLKIINEEKADDNEEEEEEKDERNERSWLTELWIDFRRRFIELLSSNFRLWSSALAYEVLAQPKISKSDLMTLEQLNWQFTEYDLRRLEKYVTTRTDYFVVKDLVPRLARLFFNGRMNVDMKTTQSIVLVGVGLQGKTTQDLIKDVLNKKEEKGIESQIVAYLDQAIKILLEYMRTIQNKKENESDDELEEEKTTAKPLTQSLDEELIAAANEYKIQCKEADWKLALANGPKSIVSIQRQKRKLVPEEIDYGRNPKKIKNLDKKKKKKNKNKRFSSN